MTGTRRRGARVLSHLDEWNRLRCTPYVVSQMVEMARRSIDWWAETGQLAGKGQEGVDLQGLAAGGWGKKDGTTGPHVLARSLSLPFSLFKITWATMQDPVGHSPSWPRLQSRRVFLALVQTPEAHIFIREMGSRHGLLEWAVGESRNPRPNHARQQPLASRDTKVQQQL